MTTIIIIKSVEHHASVREILGSVVDDGERVYFLRLPTVRCLGPLIQEVNPMINYGVDYTITPLPEGYDVSTLVEFATEFDANRICIGISDRTLTGKARIDDLTQSILLHDDISGDFVVGEHAIILEELEYGD
ncbi:hypothetical protein [Natrinema hispanicum]|uniref:Uncharacterized protein n=1 Tax=Natrinema hispanicum TaxID=392421 RepID=A0A1I0IMY3_9EURY|nr:hypothetical protein [Natrinema hispanicum]SDD42117.1 hypothetical protein SAMN05192552_102232 [Natrinema hispanicum]SET98422.1 hypothetical protein SAMN04488694_1238 [Natrinema hispanicum]